MFMVNERYMAASSTNTTASNSDIDYEYIDDDERGDDDELVDVPPMHKINPEEGETTAEEGE